MLYRVWQFWVAFTAQQLPANARQEIGEILQLAENQLFDRFSQSDQWHGYRVMCALREANYCDPALLTAALLHDIGKTCYPLTVWERSLAVVLALFMPQRVRCWGQGEARGWRRPFVVKVQHPAWGADMVAAVGGDPLTVALIRRHQDDLAESADSAEDKLLRLLQWADNQN